MLNFDAWRLRLDQRVGNLPGAQDLAADGVRGDPRREIHRRSEMTILSQQRGAMMQAGANHREVPAIGDRHGESRQRIVGDQRVGKTTNAQSPVNDCNRPEGSIGPDH